MWIWKINLISYENATFKLKLISRKIPLQIKLTTSTIDSLFCRIDKDRNGSISADELQQALSNGNQKHCTIFKRVTNEAIFCRHACSCYVSNFLQWFWIFAANEQNWSGTIDMVSQNKLSSISAAITLVCPHGQLKLRVTNLFN